MIDIESMFTNSHPDDCPITQRFLVDIDAHSEQALEKFDEIFELVDQRSLIIKIPEEESIYKFGIIAKTAQGESD